MVSGGNLVPGLNKTLLNFRAAKAQGLLAATVLATRKGYAAALTSTYHCSREMETALDNSLSPAVKYFWGERHAGALRREMALMADLQQLDAWPPAEPTIEVKCYIGVIRDAAQRDGEDSGARLLAGL